MKEIEIPDENLDENLINSLGYKGARLAFLLDRKRELSTPEKMGNEEQQITGIKEEYEGKINRLLLQAKNLKGEENCLIEAVQKERKTANEELINELGKRIRIGNPPATSNPSFPKEYVGEISFGIREEDAIKLLETAIENKVNVGIFLQLSEFFRESLEYSWQEDLHFKGQRRKRKLFSADEYLVPDFDQVEESLNSGIDILFGLFAYRGNSETEIEKAKEFIREAKKRWNGIDEFILNPEYSKAIICFFDLLISNNEIIEIFRRPSFVSFHYGYFSVKLK